MQTKIFPRQLLDLKSRLIIRKTQFAKTLAKWKRDNTSQGCKMCQVKEDIQIAELNPSLFTCPFSLSIIEHRTKLTKQTKVTPLNILFTSHRCTHKVDVRDTIKGCCKNTATVLFI